MKPRVFIGSSSENLDVAYAVQESLEHVAEVTVWDQGIFNPSRYNLESLIDALFATDFSVFVFVPDDVTSIRGQNQPTVRDNVIFELGLFIGRLGRERCYILVPKAEQRALKLPTDLLGLSPLAYDSNRRDCNLRAALGPPCSKVSKNITRLGISNLASRSSSPSVIEAQQREVHTAPVTDSERVLLHAMVAGDYSQRSITGLSKDTGLSKSEINSSIATLMKKGLVEQNRSQKSGQPRWFPTEAGRILVAGDS